ncbi:hypothetical protein GYMLUDRAFT_49649 [Collybiopsis luxurians FD-317 M1]|uniref:Uncharacterized protein n=1 Tax=Collybiopsis luxurians FD-317 M1 TaxID=944289 RepID=A0A0D0CDH1_9AGAR|nr:hypothetical protein GYMLUDRAFT_49649 [Collybiopsis luxurians FD-317 M1]
MISEFTSGRVQRTRPTTSFTLYLLCLSLIFLGSSFMNMCTPKLELQNFGIKLMPSFVSPTIPSMGTNDSLKQIVLPSSVNGLNTSQTFLIRMTDLDSPNRMIGADSFVYPVIEPSYPPMVAKKLRLEAFLSAQDMSNYFESEVSHLQTVESGSLYITSGQEQVTGDLWIIMKKVNGSPLTKINPTEYEQILSGPKLACESFFNARYSDLVRAVLDLEKSSGLVHRDPSDSNTLWISLTEFSGLIDFGAMVLFGSEDWFRVLEEEFVDGQPVPKDISLEDWLMVVARRNWPLKSCVGN